MGRNLHTHTHKKPSEKCWIRWIYVLFGNSNVSHKSHPSWTETQNKHLLNHFFQIIIHVVCLVWFHATALNNIGARKILVSFCRDKSKTFPAKNGRAKVLLRIKIHGISQTRMCDDGQHDEKRKAQNNRQNFQRIKIVKLKVRIKVDDVWKSHLFERNRNKNQSAPANQRWRSQTFTV